jgi:diguanylate cyclase
MSDFGKDEVLVNNFNGSGACSEESSSLVSSLSKLVGILHKHLQKAKQKTAELERENALLRQQAYTDSLTGLANRRALDEWVNNDNDRRKIHPENHLFAIDMNGFKQINDTYGHAVGDDALRHVARLLEELIRKDDIAFRQGGDEFIILFLGMNAEGASCKAAEIHAKFEKNPFCFNGESIALACAIGMEPFTAEQDVRAVVERADHAMYRGKNSAPACAVA